MFALETMNCPNCNNEINGSKKFCSKCGTQLPTAESTPTEATEAMPSEELISPDKEKLSPLQELDAANKAEIENLSDSADTGETLSSENPEDDKIELSTGDEKPKKRFNWKKFLIITVPIVALVLVIVFNINLIIGYAIKLFGSPAQYLAYVESKSIEKSVDTYLSFYNNFSENLKYDGSSKTTMKLTLSDKGYDLLDSFVKLNTDVDISEFKFLKDIGLTFDYDTTDKVDAATASISLSNNQILCVKTYIDKNEEYAYIGFPELSDEYVKIPYSSDYMMFNPYAASAQTSGTQLLSINRQFIKSYVDSNDISMDTVQELLNRILPTEKELKKSLTNYVKTALDCIDDAKMDSTNLHIDDFSKKVTQITVDVDSDLMARMAIAVLRDIRNDNNVKNIINRAAYAYKDTFGPMGADELYPEFQREIDSLIQSLEESLKSTDYKNTSYFELHTYVNNWHEVLGHAFVVKDSEGKNTKYVTAMITQNKEFRYISEMPGGVTVNGRGTKTNSELSGDFVLAYKGYNEEKETELIKFTCSNFNYKEFEKGNLKGSLTITPLEGLIKEMQMDDSLATFVSLSDLSLKIDCDINQNKSYMALSVAMGNNPLVTLSLDSAHKTTNAVMLPQNTISADDENDLVAWVMGFDFSKLADNLDKAGVPQEYVEAFRLFSSMPTM